jgi:hypothetical protein
MNERELSESLLAYDAAEVSNKDPRKIAAQIIRRDQCWTRFWSVGVILVWFVAIGLICPMAAMIGNTFTETGATMQKLIDATKIESNLPHHLDQAAEAVFFAMPKVALLLMIATILTVLLVRSSRRATLRQVNANLMQISRQLEGLSASANAASE